MRKVAHGKSTFQNLITELFLVHDDEALTCMVPTYYVVVGGVFNKQV